MSNTGSHTQCNSIKSKDVKNNLMKMLRGSSNPKHFFNPIEVRGDKKAPLLTSFSPVTSTNKEISPKNFITFSSDSFTTLP